MKLNRGCSILSLRLQLSGVEAADLAEVTAVEVVTDVAEEAVAAVAVVKTPKIKINNKHNKRLGAVVIRVPGTRTSLQESGLDVEFITEMEKMHTFVQSQRRVPGRIFSNQETNIEKSTSSVKILSCLMTLYIKQSQKYKQ